MANLLPGSLARRFEHRRQARKWASVWTVVVCALLHAQITVERTCARSTAALADLETMTRPIDLLVNESHQLRQEAEKVRQAIVRRVALEQGEAPLALLQVVVDCFRRGAGELQLDSYQMDETLPPLPIAEGAKTDLATPRKKLVLTGSAKSDVAVSKLVQNLRSVQIFSQVKLDSSQATTDKSDIGRMFQLQCEL